MKAPEIKHYIDWLGRVEYRNINCSFTYDETSYAAIDRIFRLLHRLEPGPENTSWELWLRAERGTIEDFGSFEELRADGQVESFEEFETWWHSEFPEEAAWFHFAAGEDQKIGYRAIFLGHRHVLEVDGRRERSFPNDISKFTAWLEEAVRDTVQMVETGSYQELVERELPMGQPFRTIDDARRFFQLYRRPDDTTPVTDDFLRQRLTATGREDFPLYLPQNRRFGLLRWETCEIPNQR